MIVNETQTRQYSRWINENWDEVLQMDTYEELAERLTDRFQRTVLSGSVSVIMSAISGTRDVLDEDGEALWFK